MGHEAILYDLGSALPPFPLWEDSTACFLLSPIRYGRHLPVADAFLRSYGKEIGERPLVLISLNLTARKKGRDTLESNPYLKRWIKKHKLRPFIAAVFAGRLDYGAYTPWDRAAIRLIMKITGGPTDPATAVDYTPWDKIAALARRAALLAPPTQEESVA